MTELLIYSTFSLIQVYYSALPEYGQGNYFKSCPAVLIFDFLVSHHLHLLEPLSGFGIYQQTALISNLKKRLYVCLCNYMYDYSYSFIV